MPPDILSDWLAALEARHLANLRVPEVTRALRALSSAYVERRQVLARGAALDSAGKRAAFALFYAPLHMMVIRGVIERLGAHAPPPTTIADAGCGTGAAGAAWALAAGGSPRIIGIDRHPWAVEEARWTYARLGLHGQARQGDVGRFRPPRGHGIAILAAYVLNELPDASRDRLVRTLVEAAGCGACFLIVEPISRAVAPWWDSVALVARAVGGRSDEWRIDLDLPPMLTLFDRAAGLDHRQVKVRSIFVPPRGHSHNRRDATIEL